MILKEEMKRFYVVCTLLLCNRDASSIRHVQYQ